MHVPYLYVRIDHITLVLRTFRPLLLASRVEKEEDEPVFAPVMSVHIGRLGP